MSNRGRDGHSHLLYFDTQYNATYSLLHEDAEDEAQPIRVAGVDPRRLEVRLLTPLDLAVSKLSRFEGNDRDDILALAKLGLIDAKSLRKRAEQALPGYVGNTERVKNSIDIACKLVEKQAKGK